jgi:hypothetical protein
MNGWLALYHADGGPDPRIVLSWSRWDGNGVTGHPVVCCILGTLRKPDHALVPSFRPGLHLLSAPLFPPPRPVLQRVCGPFICVFLPFRFSFFCWQAPARTCALIHYAINSTDPRFPVGLWAPFASHRLQTFVVWGYRLLKKWSPSFLRLLR